MQVHEKIDKLGVKFIADRAGVSEWCLYRWRKNLVAGKGISDASKAALILASQGTEHPIAWPDFAPPELAAVAQ